MDRMPKNIAANKTWKKMNPGESNVAIQALSPDIKLDHRN